MNYLREAKKNIFIKAAIVIIAVLFVLVVMEYRVDKPHVYKPSYEEINLDYIIEKAVDIGLTEDEYRVLFEQTGLGASAIDYILKNEKDYKVRIKDQQQIFFYGYPYTCVKMGMLTSNERMRDENGKKIKGYALADLQPGDVLISLSTHTLGYRHGHSGMVVSKPKKGKEAKTIEAVYWSEPTEYQTTGKWRTCPTFVHLRISEEAAASKGYTQEELGALLAKCAKEDGIDVKYGLFPTIFNLNADGMRRTHCSHLIWYVFNQFGFDVDSNGGFIITPHDIIGSDLFEIVQIYGIDPNF